MLVFKKLENTDSYPLSKVCVPCVLYNIKIYIFYIYTYRVVGIQGIGVVGVIEFLGCSRTLRAHVTRAQIKKSNIKYQRPRFANGAYLTSNRGELIYAG